MKKKISFIRFIKLWGIVLLITLASIIIGIDILISYRDFNISAAKMREEYIASQKQMIRQEVYQVVDLINHERAQSEKLTRSRIRSRVYEAYSIAKNIYQENRNRKSKDEIQRMILDALKPIRFERGSGYYFVVQPDPVELLLTDKTDKEELQLKDDYSRNVIREMAEIARRDGEGYYEYQWAKPNREGKNHTKIAFIKLFEPFGLCIGTGLYVEDVEKEVKADLLAVISRIRFGKEGYIFINRLNGDALVTNGQVFPGDKKLWELFEADREKTKDVFNKEYNAAQKPEGDYIYYTWAKLSDLKQEAPKTSFIYGISDLQWIVGAGVYLDDVEKSIALMRNELNNQIKTKMLWFILIDAGIVILFLLVLNVLTRRLKKDFEYFILFIKKAAASNKLIKHNMIRFTEFEEMARDTDKILRDKFRAQQELLDEREQLFVTIRSIGDGVITTDKAGRVELMNKVAEKLTGWDVDEAKGKPLTEVFKIVNENTRKVTSNPVNRVLKSGKVIRLSNHTVLISKDGREYNIVDSAAPIKDVKSKIRGVVLVFRDITEQMKIEKELLKSKKLESVGVLAGGIAHDFNNILTGLFGNIEIAKLKVDRNHAAYTYLETAGQALERAVHLTKQLLTFAKGGEPILEAVDLKSVVQKTVAFNLSGSNVKAHYKLPDNLWQIEADKGQISHVIANLTINAKEAMPDGGNLYIDAENIKDFRESSARYLSGDFVKLSIRDEGIGIPAKHLEKIFDPYFSTKQSGSGLGLAIIHSIISKHQGHIRVESTYGVGTTFTIYLPAEKSVPETETPPRPETKEELQSTLGHILIMDDEEMIRNVAAAMLKLFGYTLDFAANGKEAIAKFSAARESGKPFDIVIMDLTIPGGMGGKEAVQGILDLDPAAKVIVASGYSTDPVMANYGKYGFKGRIVKPFQVEDLKKELARVMGMK